MSKQLTEIHVEVVLGVLGRLLRECVQRLVVQVAEVADGSLAARHAGVLGRLLGVVGLLVVPAVDQEFNASIPYSVPLSVHSMRVNTLE